MRGTDIERIEESSVIRTSARLLPLLGLAAALLLGAPVAARAQGQPNSTFSVQEVVDAGNQFFGEVSQALASVVERASSRYGQPNGYILGEEGSAAFFGGLRYGEGTLYTRNAGSYRVYWQGPSLGLDVGGDGARTMILVYNLPSVDAIFRRYGGVTGSAYLVGGFGMTALTSDNIVVVPVRSGIGARLGINLGYLKFTPQPTWNPF